MEVVNIVNRKNSKPVRTPDEARRRNRALASARSVAAADGSKLFCIAENARHIVKESI